MSYLYTPPLWRNSALFPGAWALRNNVMTSTTVYRIGGVWFNVETTGMDSPVMSTIDVDPSGLLLFFTRPTVIPDSLHDALAALQQADPSWTPATLVPV